MSDGVWFEDSGRVIGPIDPPPSRPRQPQVWTDGGPWANHDMPCPVCRKNFAILYLNDGVFYPCTTCQLHGWRLKQRRWWRGWRPRG